MHLLRSWPRSVPAGRSYVVDDIDRFTMDVDFDYRRLAMVGDDVVLVEWDLAVDPDQLRAFIERARSEPGRVRVAPYRLYYQYSDETWGDQQGEPVWAHRRYVSMDRLRWCTDHDPTCHLFGFGCVYLPAELIGRFCADETGPLGDSSFSHWHFVHAADPEVVIDWDCRPVHLNHPRIEV